VKKHRQKVWKQKQRMGWKRKRNKEIMTYITLFLVCVIVAGTLSFATERATTLKQKSRDQNSQKDYSHIPQEVLDNYLGWHG